MSLLELLYRWAVLNRVGDAPGPFDLARVRKILVVRNDNIGDVICTTPALDRVYAYLKAKHKQHGALESLLMLARVLGQIRAEDFDLALALRSSFSSSQGWLAYASRARWRVGPGPEGKKARWGFYYNHPAPPMPKNIHEVERSFHFLKHIQVDSQDKRLYVDVPAPAAAKAAGFLADHGLNLRPGPLMLNLNRPSYRPDRHWPDGNYRELASELARRSEGLVITHAPADAPWVAETLAGIEPAPAVYCSPSLKEYAAMLSRARAFITAEGGPMHLAAGVGVPRGGLVERHSPGGLASLGSCT